MITKLEVPAVDGAMQGGKVLRWHKREGDTIAFGEDICELAIDEFAVLRRTARATLLTRRRRDKLKSDLETREGVYFEVVVTSSDTGVLRKIVAEEGVRIGVGDLLAVATTDADEPLDGDADRWREAPALRVVVNRKGDEWDEGD